MPIFEKKTAMPVSARALYDWHMQPGAFERLLPPWQKVRVLQQPEVLEEGALLVMKVYLGPLGLRWEALHRDFVEGRQFVDEQVRGPFARWEHTHLFVPDGPTSSFLHDYVEYEVPLGKVGAVLGAGLGRAMLEKMFAYRHQQTVDDLSRE